MPTRVLLSFKDNEIDKELLDFLLEKSAVIGKGAYMKQLLQLELERLKDEK